MQVRRGNKKIKNATPIIVEGIKFRSKLEAYTYQQFLLANIHVEYESQTFTLLPSFIYQGVKIRPITYKPDFVGNGFICEVKGFANDAFPLKKKMFLKHLRDNGFNITYFVVRNHKEIAEMIKRIKDGLQ